MIYLKSAWGYHVVKIGKGGWVFNTLREALDFIAEVRK